VSWPHSGRGAYRPGMDRRTSAPRGLTSRSVVAVGIFAAAVIPGWTLGDQTERWTGNGLLDWAVTCGWTAAAVFALARYASYRRRDAWLGLVPLYGWYLLCLLAWRVALLPYRDWEPRGEELWRARWLPGDLIGYWRVDPPSPADPAEPVARAGKARPATRRTN
jgi:hypothetical protein